MKDLCARLPYGVKVHIEHDVFYDEIEPYDSILTSKILDDFLKAETLEAKPYLRPMSSMTEEERNEVKEICADYLDDWYTAKTSYLRSAFYNSHHLDWNGLIPMGLALEAPEWMYTFN